MRARSFQKRVELWQTEEYADEISGYLNKDILITTVWAKVSTLDKNRRFSSTTADLGVEDRSNTIVVEFRKRADITYNPINQFLKYRGFKYNIQAQPTNTDFDNSYIVIIATREANKEVTELTPDNSSNTVYTNYVNRGVFNDAEEINNVCLLDYIVSIT